MPIEPIAEPSWSADIEHKKRLTKEDAKFIFDQAEKILTDTLETSETIVSRTNTLLTLISGSLLAVIGYIISRLGEALLKDNLFITAIFGAIYLYILAFYCFENTRPKSYLIAGTLPKDLFVATFFGASIPNEERIIRLYANEIDNYQYKIEVNSKLNNTRWKKYKNILRGLLLLPVVLTIISLLISWIRNYVA